MVGAFLLIRYLYIVKHVFWFIKKVRFDRMYRNQCMSFAAVKDNVLLHLTWR